MKRVIRYNVFESNSSSMHSVSIRGNGDLNEHYHSDGVIKIKLDEYGWRGDPLYDFYDKLPYAMLMVLYTEYPGFKYYDNDFTIDQEELEKLSGYKTLLEAIRKHGDCEKIIIKKQNGFYPYGYIDHQSYEDYGSLADFLKNWNIDAERFLFDDNVVVYIDNDNH